MSSPHEPGFSRPRWRVFVGLAACMMASALYGAAYGFHVDESPMNIKLHFPMELLLGAAIGVVGLVLTGVDHRVKVLGGASAAFVGTALLASAGMGLVRTDIRRALCDRGDLRQCSALGRTLPTENERSTFDERACAGGIRAACGRMARIGRGELAQSLYDGHCSVRRADLLCEAEMRDVTRLCVDSESFCGLDQ